MFSFHNLENSVPDDVKLRLEQLKHQILNGKIVVPERYHQENENGNDNSSSSIMDVHN